MNEAQLKFHFIYRYTFYPWGQVTDWVVWQERYGKKGNIVKVEDAKRA